MRPFSAQRTFISSTAIAVMLFFAACTQLKRPAPEPYFAETAAPPLQELRWSNGKTPISLDPARAASAPETDLVRALYEGLTDLDPTTLEAVPGVAERWEASEEWRVWRFYIRKDAVWSSGEPVTAKDFVRSWKRLADMGEMAAHRDLLLNFKRGPEPGRAEAAQIPAADSNASPVPPPLPAASPSVTPKVKGLKWVVAEADNVLRVELVHPDKDLPKLLAHPIFRPVFEESKLSDKDKPVTNGAFRLSSLAADGAILERSEKYWDRKSVELERVRFVSVPSPEKALELYRAGEIDVVTNAEFSSAALKLLEPFEDFRRTTHSALNLYEFNTSKAPFSDRRVRRALALAIEREKVTEGELQGSTRPAAGFLPQGGRPEQRLSFDPQNAKLLLDEAGFPGGEGFPTVRLVINRNDAQQRVARAVAQMWKQNLNIDTQIVVEDAAGIEVTIASGNYDAVRRNIVLPTSDEGANMLSIFADSPSDSALPESSASPNTPSRPGDSSGPSNPIENDPGDASAVVPVAILTEEEALYQLRSIPLYFPTSYSLVKPYVRGFDSNSLDSPSLKTVRIDQNWRTR